MSERYSGFAAASITADDTHLALISATTVRPKLYDLLVGAPDTPADQYVKWQIGRFTAVGTEGSGFTPVALDPASPAALADYGVGSYSAEPTYTANAELLVFGQNMRATFRWCAVPGSELVAPATANNGLGLVPKTAGASNIYSATMLHIE